MNMHVQAQKTRVSSAYLIGLLSVISYAIPAEEISPDSTLISALSEGDDCIAGDIESCALRALQVKARRSSSTAGVMGSSNPVLGSGTAVQDLIKGISYGPMPCKGQCEIHMDDFFGESAKALWGHRGRADLEVIRSLGANHIRLYGNSPESDHAAFFDEADSVGLGVVVGMSDYPYTQMQNNCMTTGFDCYEQIKGVYSMNLLKGFLTEEKEYHPALKHVIVINEPDLKLPGMAAPGKFVKGIISALDGMLDAEKEAGVTGRLVNFTATFSFGVCPGCQSHGTDPALGQMFELQAAMLNPKAYGYTPKNDLAAIYNSRWINSFNTAAPAQWVKREFVDKYQHAFTSIPVVIEEYNSPGQDTGEDLAEIMKTARSSDLLLGVSFFEFQKRYDKGGTEMAFGMFGLGNYSINEFDYFGGKFHSWCLAPVKTKFGAVPDSVADAYGGKRPDYAKLCAPDPSKVALNQTGFEQIASQGASSIDTFVSRVVAHLGGQVEDPSQLRSLASSVGHEFLYADLLGHIKNASWVSWNPSARKCVADRLATLEVLGQAIGDACNGITAFNCSDAIPAECNGSIWAKADFIFTAFYEEKGGDPLQNCYFSGSAVLADKDYVGRKCGAKCCSYIGSIPMLPTQPPTLPPIFGTAAPTAEPKSPAPSPAMAGDCSFGDQPAVQYFWDESCLPSGGAGCMADGKHMSCRYCGRQGFPDCPGSDAKVKPATAPVVAAPAHSMADTNNCSFAEEPPEGIQYFWDTSCQDEGGVGCMADGKHMNCRFCGHDRFPPCDGSKKAVGNPDDSALATKAPERGTGNCSFAREPSRGYFWDESCKAQGGIGCKADGAHLECRFCGVEGTPKCPTA